MFIFVMKSYLKFLSRNKLYTAIEAVGLIVRPGKDLCTGSADDAGAYLRLP